MKVFFVILKILGFLIGLALLGILIWVGINFARSMGLA